MLALGHTHTTMPLTHLSCSLSIRDDCFFTLVDVTAAVGVDAVLVAVLVSVAVAMEGRFSAAAVDFTCMCTCACA